MQNKQDFVYTGRYTRAFLNGVFGEGRYRVKSYQMHELVKSTKDAFADLDDPTLGLAYMSDTKLTLMWFDDYPGWMAFCEPLGIDISYSSKIAKRLTVLTRLAYLFLFKEDGQLDFGFCKPDEFTVYDVEHELHVRFLDGANVLSRELLEEMMTNGSAVIEQQLRTPCVQDCPPDCKQHGRGNPWSKQDINRAIDRSGSVSFRMITKHGLVKGDALVVPRAQIPGGHDVLSCDENVKRELVSEDLVFVLAEPHPPVRRHEFSRTEPAPPPVWTDDQSMSWLGEWLYPREQLKECLLSFAQETYDAIESGTFPRFFTDTEKLYDEHSLVTQFQDQALLFEERGLGLEQSIFLQERIGQGAINQLIRKRRWPVPAAMYVHVATDSWLHMAGFVSEDGEHPWPFAEPHTPRGSVWYHEATGRMVYNDLDFAELYDRHGGWDLDDSIKAHARTWRGKKVWVIVRCPNSMGEYDIKDYVEGTFHPKFSMSDGTVLEFPEVGDERPKFVEELAIKYQYPNGLSFPKPAQTSYAPDLVKESVTTAVEFRNVFGKFANAMMVYNHTMPDYRKEQLAPIEAIVDASTQEQSEQARLLIEGDTKAVIDEMRASNSVADRVLWKQRILRMYADMEYGHLEWAEMAVTHSSLCSMFKKRYFELAQRTVHRIDPEVIKLGELKQDKGEMLVEWYYELVDKVPRDESESSTVFYRYINQLMCSVLETLPPHVLYNDILGMASYVYTYPRGMEYRDTPLFQSGGPGEPSVFGYYLDAIAFYGIGQSEWSAQASCVTCGQPHRFMKRVDYQLFLSNESQCARCMLTL